MLKLIPLIALVTSVVMLYLAAAEFRTDWNRPRWRIRQSFDVLALSVGFVCMLLTSIYALLAAAIWL